MCHKCLGKFKNRKSPHFHAKLFKGRRKRGLDGRWWISKPDKNGRYRWVVLRGQASKSKKSKKKRSRKRSLKYKRRNIASPRLLASSTRKSPPYHAKVLKYKKRKGRDGKMWISVPDKNNVFHWVHAAGRDRFGNKKS